MGRHSSEDKKSGKKDPKIEKAREKALEQFFGLSKKAIAHIEWSVQATMPCSYCTADNKGSFKRDEAGECLKCHGTKLVPDIQQRNWATEEITSRVAPKPKSVEMSVEQQGNTEELKKQLEQAPAEQRDAVAKSILTLWQRNDAANS
jgi:hypothetical protein